MKGIETEPKEREGYTVRFRALRLAKEAVEKERSEEGGGERLAAAEKAGRASGKTRVRHRSPPLSFTVIVTLFDQTLVSDSTSQMTSLTTANGLTEGHNLNCSNHLRTNVLTGELLNHSLGAIIVLMPIARVRAALEANRRRETDEPEEWPVVRLFSPLGKGIWLLSQVDPNDNDTAFGLCDEGDGAPTLGHVSLAGLAHRFGHSSVRWDDSFQADKPLSAYAAEARQAGRIQS